MRIRRREETAGVAQLVERKPSKLDVAGSSPVSRFERERGTGNGERKLEATVGAGATGYARDIAVPGSLIPVPGLLA